jgi:hypothetical protein|tara:strand:- start:49 stop:417 length:369 start_codon:yes stop_codon:yes gene_type:complete
MKLFKIPGVASDALDGQNMFVDVTTLQDVDITDDDCIIAGNGWTVTFTFDGTNAAEKLLNAQKMADYLVDKMLPYVGDKMNRKEFNSVYKLWDGMTIAEIHTETGIVRTGDANTALISVALS